VYVSGPRPSPDLGQAVLVYRDNHNITWRWLCHDTLTNVKYPEIHSV
jgi:hypothetical protein